jgi:hypothetical protein
VDLVLGEVAIVNGVPQHRVRIDDGEDTNHINGYLYVPVSLIPDVTVTLGVSYDSFEEFGIQLNRVHPKLGLLWHPTSSTTLRLAAFSASKRAFAANQTIEPTQIAGFNQFFDDTNGTDSRRYGVGIDQRLSESLYAGGELSWRDVDYVKVQVPGSRTFTLANFQAFEHNQNEAFHRAYLYWTPTDRLALGAEYRFEEFDRKNLGREIFGPDELRTHAAPLTASYYHDFFT